jgi:hypothetical protein
LGRSARHRAASPHLRSVMAPSQREQRGQSPRQRFWPAHRPSQRPLGQQPRLLDRPAPSPFQRRARTKPKSAPAPSPSCWRSARSPGGREPFINCGDRGTFLARRIRCFREPFLEDLQFLGCHDGRDRATCFINRNRRDVNALILTSIAQAGAFTRFAGKPAGSKTGNQQLAAGAFSTYEHREGKR